MQIKTTRRFLTPIRMAAVKQTNKQTNKIITVSKDVEKLEHLRAVDGNVKWHSH